MKKIIFIFTLLFTLTCINSQVSAQNKLEEVTVNVGTVRTGSSFTINLHSYDYYVIGYAAHFSVSQPSPDRISVTILDGGPISGVIGEVVLKKRNSSNPCSSCADKIYTIVGNVIR